MSEYRWERNFFSPDRSAAQNAVFGNPHVSQSRRWIRTNLPAVVRFEDWEPKFDDLPLVQFGTMRVSLGDNCLQVICAARMPFNERNRDEQLTLSAKRRIDRLADEFEVAWQRRQNPRIEDFLSRVVDAERIELLKVLVAVELALRRARGDEPSVEEYERRFGDGDNLGQFWNVASSGPEMDTQVTHDVAAVRAEVKQQEPSEPPEYIGRYRIERLLGKGGFGLVYLAHDEKLDRLVAVKVPHGKHMSVDAKLYLDEARTVANLDHSHIAPVYDLGSTDEFPFFIVSKYVDGSDLGRWAAKRPLDYHETVELVATVAETLHYAHKQGFVHRDIKPGNILVSSDRQPHVVDFGLALREERFGKGPKYLGTPAYMSPEQARGEGHRVDPRSDVFSLGAVFYTLLTDRQPFRGESRDEVLEQVIQHEPRPPRQYDDRIPKEMERICQKAMAKRASERYSTAMDMADDLRHFLAEPTAAENVGSGSGSTNGSGFSTELDSTPAPLTPDGSDASASSATATGSSIASEPIRIVPKGLRSFDERDADFFIELVPGPRDRTGLPDSIRFWKTRIEEMEADRTFRIGLIYGPSGCGKSSLVKAGLLPNLAEHVVPVYLECTATNTETSLLRLLRKVRRDVSPDDDLIGTMKALRKGWTIPQKTKVVIVLDQFEQWLHGQEGTLDGELIRALGQCDGERLQCIIMVRDDFWLAISRFMDQLDVDLVESKNVWLVDLFDGRHARKVLTAFGRAYGCLPVDLAKLSSEQELFLDRVITELSQCGAVISVRLALFAEMVKGRPWSPMTLKEVGGTEGVGQMFLEESFTGHTANPKHRQHQKAARAVLKALLPQTGTEIKGHVRSRSELLEISGYANHEREFAELLLILDQETRLLTPTDPEGMTDAEALDHDERGRYYLLTHDYLVPALREWLARKQKETRRGRAELRLAEASAEWHGKRENRRLPNWWESLNIWLFTRKKDWTPAQRTMMGRASLFHGIRLGGLIMLLCVVFFVRNRIVADGFVSRVKDAEISSLPSIIAEADNGRRWLEPRLSRAYSALTDAEKLRISLVLIHWGAKEPHLANVTDYLIHSANADEVSIISRFLANHHSDVGDDLWRVLEPENRSEANEKLRAACALSVSDTHSKRWTQALREEVALQLVSVPANTLGAWMKNLAQIKETLIDPLGKIMSSSEIHGIDVSPWQQLLAADALAGYSADRPAELVRYLQEAKAEQFLRMYPTVEAAGDACIQQLRDALTSQSAGDVSDSPDRTASRRANAAVALLKMGSETEMWRLLPQTRDPALRSYLIHRLPRLEVAPGIVVRRLLDESERSMRRAIILTLGGYEPHQVPQADREHVIARIEEWYSSDTDPGVHAAAGWLLRRWGLEDKIMKLDAKFKEDSASDRSPADQDDNWWYINSAGQTMVVIRGPVTFNMGSPESEPDRNDNETRHTVAIPRSFAISTHEVSKEQFKDLIRVTYPSEVHRYHPENDCPIGGVAWYDAAEYCNRLSERENLSKCYIVNPDQVSLPPDYLSRTGYRLPTEAEWEYACRAGSDVSRYYGHTSELLPEYAWGFNNSASRSRPVGLLKPNDFGLFDMYGNVSEWCQDRGMMHSSRERSDNEDTELTVGPEPRVLRGGSYQDTVHELRSAFRVWRRPGPDDRNPRYGFRVARTVL